MDARKESAQLSQRVCKGLDSKVKSLYFPRTFYQPDSKALVMIAISPTSLSSYASSGAACLCAQLMTVLSHQNAWSSANAFALGKNGNGITPKATAEKRAQHGESGKNKGHYFIERSTICRAIDLPQKLLLRPGKRSQITYERSP
jgi:hypothetical protein